MPDQNGWTLVQPAAQAAAGWSPVQPAQAPDTSSFLDAATNFVKNFAHNVDPRPALKMVYDVVQATPQGGAHFDPLLQDVKGLGQAQVDQFKKGWDAYKQGRISEAVGHTIAGALPLVGPPAAAAGEQIGSGDVSGGLGSAAGLVAPIVAGPALARAAKTSVPVSRGLTPPSSELAAAVRFGQEQGIPIDAATATGSDLVRSIQKKVSDSMGGAGTAERFKAAQAKGLATVGEQLAAKANQGAATAEQAGQAVTDAVRGNVRAQAAAADAAYAKLRALEAADSRPVQTGTRTIDTGIVDRSGQPITRIQPITQQMGLTVDLAPVKTALRPAYDQLAREAKLGIPAMGQKGAALAALDRIVNGPDVAPLSVADAALGDLKSFARADEPALRTIGQGAAANAVAKLGAAVTTTAKAAGQDVYAALQEGRQATIAKYAAGDVLDSLAQEPVQTTARLTAPRDAGLRRLQAVAEQAPQVIPQVARSVLDGMMDKATEAGSFQHADALYAQWQKMGDGTKAVLFKDPAYIQSLDNFFLLAKKIAENPNPSGTARINNLFNVGSALVGYPTAKLLYSPGGVRLLTEGLRIPLQSPSAVASYTARLTAALKQQAALQPLTADDSQEQTPPTIGRRY